MISFNNKYVKTLSKTAFVKKFEKVYPDADLEKEYYKIVPKKEKPEEQN